MNAGEPGIPLYLNKTWTRQIAERFYKFIHPQPRALLGFRAIEYDSSPGHRTVNKYGPRTAPQVNSIRHAISALAPRCSHRFETWLEAAPGRRSLNYIVPRTSNRQLLFVEG